MNQEEIISIHSKLLDFLLDWKKRNSRFTFTLRKSDFSERLSLGYWFHGNNDYIPISFWTGMDWKAKVPNIAFLIFPDTRQTLLQFSARDSNEKNELIQSFFEISFNLKNLNNGFYRTIPEQYFDE